jgi:hypothetical protein
VLSVTNPALLVWLHRRARRIENLVDRTNFLARWSRVLVVNRPGELSSRLRILLPQASYYGGPFAPTSQDRSLHRRIR